MRGKEQERAIYRRIPLMSLGVDPDRQRGFVGQAGAIGMEGPLLRLPATMLPQVNLQDPDTLDTFYTTDYDEIDGDALIQ